MAKEKNYTFEEACQSALSYFGGDEQVARQWVNKYALKSDAQHLDEQSPDDMLWTLARMLTETAQEMKHKLTPDDMHRELVEFFQSRRQQEYNRTTDETETVKSGSDALPVVEVRPPALECDVVRFQNNKEKWVALVGLLDGYPYEIFTGLQDDDEGIILPKSVTKGKILKQTNPDGTKRYDFQFENKRGYKTTVEGLSEKFNPEYWNYAKLISGVLRYRMPIEHVIKLVSSLQLKDESINTWKNGVERALKKYLNDGSEVIDIY